MKINTNFPVVHPVCINLEQRKKKRKMMIKQSKKMNMKLNFYTATLHENPKRGCMESHLNVIREAIAQGHKYLLVLEDDALFLTNMSKLPTPPSDWDMLYLGGTVKHIFTQDAQEELARKNKRMWLRMTCWTTHAYILNLRNKKLIKDILDAEKCGSDMEIDRYYGDKIHVNYKCYMIYPMICIQRAGHSDIEDREVDYSFMEQSILGLRKPPHEIQPDGSYRLKMPSIPPDQMPGVTIITPTRNREWIFSLPLFCFQRMVYPADKLEWIIIDSSDDEELKHILPASDDRIRYVHVDEPCTVAHKRNIGCKLAKHDIIVHMDDDDYYPPESILARVKLLVGHEDVGCVGCSRIAIYSLLEDKSLIASDGHMSLSEASMAYKKSFWKEQQFDPGCERGEYRSFLQNRLNKVMDIPYIFIICASHHGRNMTERFAWRDGHDPGQEVLRHKETNKIVNFPDTWDNDSQMFMKSLRSYLLSSEWYMQKYGQLVENEVGQISMAE